MNLSIADLSRHQICEFLAGLIRLAQRSAAMTDFYFNKIGLASQSAKSSPSFVSEQFALEVGAIVQIAQWERAGLRPYLPTELPDAQEANRAMWQRIRTSPEEYGGGNSGAALTAKVLRTWIQCFCPAGSKELAADILFPPQAEEDPMEFIADLLWRFRHLAYQEETS